VRSALAIVLLGLMLAPGLSAQQEFSFDLSEVEKKSISFGGYLEFQPRLLGLDFDAALYRVQAGKLGDAAPSPEFSARALLDGRFDKGMISALVRLNAEFGRSGGGWSSEAAWYEGYVSIKPSPAFRIDLGKKRLKWGKGYAWNPAAFLDRAKNPNDPDLALEGHTVLAAEFTRSFSGPLRTFSLMPVLVPIAGRINPALGRGDTLNLGGKIYLLLWDTDIDGTLLSGPGVADALGVDFSRNLGSNLEIHGEWARRFGVDREVFAADGSIWREAVDASSWLLGLRWLTAAETTFFLEIRHDGFGFDQEEMKTYYRQIEENFNIALPLDPDPLGRLASSPGDRYRSFTPMRDYLFLRILQKEPFDILYFNPSLMSIVNLADGSFSLTPELLYKPGANLELRARASFLVGGGGTEFGEKPSRWRLELRGRWFF
jgi:hypothetical protein